MDNELERPPRAYNTRDVESVRAGNAQRTGRGRRLRGLLIVAALVVALAILLATGVIGG